MGPNFFLFFNATGLLKNWRKQHFICSNLTLFIVPFFLFFSFFLFSFSFFLFFFFFFFLFPWGGGATPPPAPLNDASGSNIRTGSAAYFWLIGFLINFLCIVAPPVGTRSRRVRFVFFYRSSYVESTSRQHLTTVIRYADCVKQRFRPSRRRLVANLH